MTHDEYRKAYLADPLPVERFRAGFKGAVLYFRDYSRAVDYYTAVFGPPAYTEGEGTRGWFLGGTTLTLLAGGRGSSGGPENTELVIEADRPEEVDRIQAAFIAAGGHGQQSEDTLMYWPVRYASVTDPFGTTITITAPRLE
jgi:uncharacterized glyoxalase superfamily protein PhnB